VRNSFDHLVGASEQRRRYGEAERVGSFEVDDEFEFSRLFDRQVFGSGSFENLVNVGGGAAEKRGGSQVRTTSSRRHPRTLVCVITSMSIRSV
jgi:hypothetical protein